MALKNAQEIPTIDVNLVTFKTAGETPKEYAITTGTKVAVAPEIEVTDAVKLIIKGILKAQKPEMKTLTGHTITLTDNVFSPEVVQILQGGEIEYDDVDEDKIVGYTPPVAGSAPGGEPFILCCYSAQYNAAGQIVQYEKIEYPNCVGSPLGLGSEDGVFRASEYAIFSAPDIGEAPYEISYVSTLPTVS